MLTGCYCFELVLLTRWFGLSELVLWLSELRSYFVFVFETSDMLTCEQLNWNPHVQVQPNPFGSSLEPNPFGCSRKHLFLGPADLVLASLTNQWTWHLLKMSQLPLTTLAKKKLISGLKCKLNSAAKIKPIIFLFLSPSLYFGISPHSSQLKIKIPRSPGRGTQRSDTVNRCS